MDPGLQLFRANFGRWIAASMGAALLTWFMLTSRDSDPAAGSPAGIDTATVLTVFAPLALAVVHVLQTSLYVALRRETELADLDREWLGRVNAMILRLAVGWTVFALGCLILPLLVSLVHASPTDRQLERRAHIGHGCLVRAGRRGRSVARQDLAIGRKALSRSRASWIWCEPILPAALGVLFAVCLLVAFGGVLNFVLAQLQVCGQAPGCNSAMSRHSRNGCRWSCRRVVAGILFIGVMMFRTSMLTGSPCMPSTATG